MIYLTFKAPVALGGEIENEISEHQKPNCCMLWMKDIETDLLCFVYNDKLCNKNCEIFTIIVRLPMIWDCGSLWSENDSNPGP